MLLFLRYAVPQHLQLGGIGSFGIQDPTLKSLCDSLSLYYTGHLLLKWDPPGVSATETGAVFTLLTLQRHLSDHTDSASRAPGDKTQKPVRTSQLTKKY